MTLTIITHPAGLEHSMGEGHPERPERLAAVLELLDQPPFDQLPREEAPRADRAQLERVHDPAHVRRLFDMSPAEGLIMLDPDTRMGPSSLEAALRAAGAVIRGTDLVLGEAGGRVFCPVRPPGHHAEPDKAMGFCLFNSVAVAAAHALEHHGLDRVVIVDFDVHHGNGTQAAMADEPRCLYLSSHQSPLYPGTGGADERGSGNIVNAPLSPGAGSEAFREAWEETLLPALAEFRPQLIFISAGFDGHRADPLATMELETEDFGWLTRKLVEVADEHAQGRLVSALEGGYDLEALKDSVGAHLEALGA
jgi:acetoin utilization deacetylase AcuC-like enzyme